jgi:OmpA-OmpF porin, OOP family
MKHCCYFILSLIPVLQGIAQTNKYLHPSLAEIHFSLSDFHKTFPGNTTSMDGGVGLAFIKGISNHVDWKVSVNGSYPENLPGNNNSNDKGLLLAADGTLRFRLFANDKRLQPYLQAGVGVSKYKAYYGAYAPAGLGLQARVFKDAYIILNSQYRQQLAGLPQSYFFHSIGFAGTVSRKKPVPVKRPIVETMPVVTRVRDSDQDGIVDSADVCPDKAGLLIFKGCPDTDGDGLQDREDSCPLRFGVAKYKGCPVPDTDKDGVNDEEDKCINDPGPVENAGCPVISNDLKAQVDLAARSILFNSGSATLTPGSFQSLEKLVDILSKNPGLKLSIEGHTDNIGTMASNQLLSERRAKSIMDYLTSRGIEQNRLIARGFGQDRPIADNSTSAGRAKNRRVELRLSY